MSNTDPINKSGVDATGYHVVVRPDIHERVSSGGIILPDAAIDDEQYAVNTGILVSVGDTAWADQPAWAKVGDRVMYPKYGGALFGGTDGKDYRMMVDENIHGVLATSKD